MAEDIVQQKRMRLVRLHRPSRGWTPLKVRLKSQPYAPAPVPVVVTLRLAGGSAANIHLSTSVLSFDQAGWSTPQTVTVTAGGVGQDTTATIECTIGTFITTRIPVTALAN